MFDVNKPKPVEDKDPLDLLSAEQQDLVLQGKAKIEDFVLTPDPAKSEPKKLFE